MAQTSLKKIAVLGAESTGKTWLCEELARHYQTAWVPEYAREYFNDSDIYNYTLHDLEIIAECQMQLETEAMSKAHRFLFCDTTLITLKIWAELEFQKTPELITRGIEQSHYDFYLITNNDVAWEADPLRQNKHSRDLLFHMNEMEVKKTGVAYQVISGQGTQRLQAALRALQKL